MNAALKRVRELMTPTPGRIEIFHMDNDQIESRVFKLPDALKFDPSDVETNFAQAAMENTMSLPRETSLAEALNTSLNDHAAKVAEIIQTIKDEQSVADQAHSDAIAALNAEIAERNKVHADLTAHNNNRVADANLTLQAIDVATGKLSEPTRVQITADDKNNVRTMKRKPSDDNQS